jgi:tetratricopeptide (TPR) repeat protein
LGIDDEADLYAEAKILLDESERAKVRLLTSMGYDPKTASYEIELGLRLRFADPLDLMTLEFFYRRTLAILDLLREALGPPPKETRDLEEALRGRSLDVDVIAGILVDAIAIRWFRPKSEGTRKRILNKKAEFNLRANEAHEVVRLNRSLYGDRSAFEQIGIAADIYVKIGQTRHALRLYREMQDQLKMDEQSQAITWHNIAICLAELGRNEEALSVFIDLCEFWKLRGMEADWIITRGYVGWVMSKNGMGEEAHGEFQSIMEAMAHLAMGVRIEYICRHILGRAIRSGEPQMAIQVAEIGAEAVKSRDDEDSNDYFLYFQAMISAIAENPKADPDSVMINVRPPEEFRVYKTRDNAIVPIVLAEPED